MLKTKYLKPASFFAPIILILSSLFSTQIHAESHGIDDLVFDDKLLSEELVYPDWFKLSLGDLRDDLKEAKTSGKKGIILLKTKADETNVYVEVIDNGEGMSKEVMAKIFDPFYTTKAVGEGTGLGLSISYKIIQEHGGILSVASMEGRGSKFKITLPIKKNSEQEGGQ